MNGSEKQIEWAESIRARCLSQLPFDTPAEHRELLSQQNDAGWWIDRRGFVLQYPERLIGELAEYAVLNTVENESTRRGLALLNSWITELRDTIDRLTDNARPRAISRRESAEAELAELTEIKTRMSANPAANWQGLVDRMLCRASRPLLRDLREFYHN